MNKINSLRENEFLHITQNYEHDRLTILAYNEASFLPKALAFNKKQTKELIDKLIEHYQVMKEGE